MKVGGAMQPLNEGSRSRSGAKRSLQKLRCPIELINEEALHSARIWKGIGEKCMFYL
jgi:hypothetical protein